MTNATSSGARIAGLSALFLSCAMMISQVHAAKMPSQEEMWELIQQQQKTIAELKAKVDDMAHEASDTSERLAETEKKVVATEEKVQQNEEIVAENSEIVAEVEAEQQTPSWADRTQVGGYGELHYNNLDGKQAEVDFHRFVLFFGHQFTDSLRFFSELELEHAVSGDGKPGEIELEQAYIEYDLASNHHIRGGLYLIPVGILNETHEPNTFFGVERNPVEKNIIPTTWYEAAGGAWGAFAPGWSYDVLASSGLDVPTSGSNAYLIRKGRKKVAKAPASDGAFTGRIKYTGIAGLELAASGQYQMDITQGAEDINATLFTAHAAWRKGGWGFRALYAGWWLSDGPAMTGPKALGRDEQTGFYLEPSYRFSSLGSMAIPGEAGIFYRYNNWNNNGGANGLGAEQQHTAGLNYWPHYNVALKFDYQWQNARAGDHDGFNLGIGYQF